MEDTPIMSTVVYRTLTLVAALNNVGHEPNHYAIDGYATTPMPSDERYEMIFGHSMSNMYRRVSAEPVVEFLLNVGWVDLVESGGLVVTGLGRYVLKAHKLVSGDSGESQVCEVLNSSEDDAGLPVTQLTRIVGEAGNGMLVDPYFKEDMLDWLLKRTSISRVLVKKHYDRYKKSDIEQLLATALYEMRDAIGERLSVRITSDEKLHDRCILSEDGSVSLIGASLTGVQSHLTVIYPLPSPVQRSYTTTIEEIWKEADVIEPQPLRSEPDVSEKDAGDKG